jgi:UDP-N-acetylglucosamine/UDP-N-acetylgalactosamine diphosphorylase
VVCRSDYPHENGLITESDISTHDKSFRVGFYRSIKHRVYNNICYIANLLALRQWYAHVRQPFFQQEHMGAELYAGAMDKLEIAIDERLKRFKDLSLKMETSIELGRDAMKKGTQEELLKQKNELSENWPRLEETFTTGKEVSVDLKNRDSFIKLIRNRMKDEGDYITVIQSLNRDASIKGTAWLQNLVDHVIHAALMHLPSCNS